MKKKVAIMITSVLMMLTISISALAAGWQADAVGWWYDNGDGTYKKSEWFTEADGKSYYFGTDGYMMVNSYTPDGYWVGPDGVWVPAQAAPAQAASQTVQTTAKPASEGLLAVPASQTDGTNYVLNRHTGKIHYSNCSSVKDIKDVNYGTYKGNRDLLINNGYSPCGKCHP